VQQVNYQRALEGELARTISGLDDVEHARVHLTMPKESLFEREEAKTTASVVVALGAGRTLGEREIAGITHLVASSVPRLDAGNVTVIDERGRILSAPTDEESVAGLSKGQLETQRRIEDYLAKKSQSLLEGVLGPGKAIVKVNAEVDFRQIDETKETYDPNNTAVRSEERVEETGQGAQNGSAERSITNYEMNRTIQRILGAAGTVKRLSVAVFVDGKWIADPKAKKGTPPVYEPRSPEEIEKLSALVRTAVGFDAERGDRVEVANLPFEGETIAGVPSAGRAAAGAVAAAGPAWKSLALDLLGKATPFLILLAVLLFLRRSMTDVASTFAEKKEAIETSLLPDRPMDEVEARKVEIRTRVEKLAVDRPSEVAALIRSWMMED
jgi:flagellar M-ring protein FliF